MTHNQRPWLSVSLFILINFFVNTIQATDTSEKKYNEVTRIIEKLQKHIHRDERRRSTLEAKVERADNNINQMQQSINRTNQQFKSKQKNLDQLETRINQYKTTLQQQQTVIGQHLRAIYEIQQQNLLSQPVWNLQHRQ